MDKNTTNGKNNGNKLLTTGNKPLNRLLRLPLWLFREN